MYMSFCCRLVLQYHVFFFFKQKTAYEMRISDWSSDVCSSDLSAAVPAGLISRCRRWRFAMRMVAIRWTARWQQGWEARSRRRSAFRARSEERRVGQRVSVRVDLGGRRIIKKKKNTTVK